MSSAIQGKEPQVSYPTRFQMVGGMYCLFISCYKQGKFPICSLGPSWGFTLILFLFAGLCMAYLGFMVLYAYNHQRYTACYMISSSVFLNIFLLCGGILADPGVDPSIYERYTMARYGNLNKKTEAEAKPESALNSSP
mmetsp:Transcript_4657/g.7907  ORF Transcript_4657/g.7907 Transcript_4657/m.7907 type:complete len:138 (-) Transcript_4657:731-1144(-)